MDLREPQVRMTGKKMLPTSNYRQGAGTPSAMQMSNGSIIVMGGEQCSNCAAVPNMELLPKVGGLVNLDFLQRTDPYNLYPFLTVLPGGGIVSKSWNVFPPFP